MTEQIDISGKIGELFPAQEDPEWPMYSYSRPAAMLWNSIAGQLHKNGCTEDQIKGWLQSKATRWALDGSLGDQIAELGIAYARIIPDKDKRPA